MPQRIAVVIPCYNTTSRCADVVARTMPFADAIVAVDDGSIDDTAEHLRASGCLVLQLPVNSGKGAALAAGFREVLKGSAGPLGARADYVVTIDGDGQHDPADIPRLVDCARRSGADLVLGMRNPARDAAEEPGRRALLAAAVSHRHEHVRGRHAVRFQAAVPRAGRRADRSRQLEGIRVGIGGALESHRARSNGRVQPRSRRSTSMATGEVSSMRGETRCRIASVFARQLRWTVSMAMLDFARVRSARAFGIGRALRGRTSRRGSSPSAIRPRFVTTTGPARDGWCAGRAWAGAC